MTVCFFGNYLKQYPRVAVMRKGLMKAGVQVLECHTRERGVSKYISLARQLRAYTGMYDVLLVMMGGQMLTWFARACTRRPIVYDAFVSLYATNVHDRKKNSEHSVAARWYHWLDRFACVPAGRVVIDTNAQKDFFVRELGVPADKLVTIPMGADDEIFFPDSGIVQMPDEHNAPFTVCWHGYIVPFHGVEVIVRAAQLLMDFPDIEFRITTRFDSKFDNIKALAQHLGASNIKFFPETEPASLARELQAADVALGVFGNNKKSRMVVPNKIFEAAACATAVITGRQPAVEELFADGQSIVFCEPDNPADLAEKIIMLKGHDSMRKKIAQGGYGRYLQVGAPGVIGRQWYDLCRQVSRSVARQSDQAG